MKLGVGLALALAGLLAPLVARAGSSGGAFAGPVNPNSSSGYWNPAALVTLPESTTALLDLTGYYLGLRYQREPANPEQEPAYPATSFTLAAPDLSFALASPTLWRNLRLAVATYAPTAGAVNWPKTGAQRYHVDRAFIITYAVTAGVVASFGPNYGLALLVGPVYGQTQLNYALDFGAFANAKLPAGAAVFELEDPRLQGHVEVRTHAWSSTMVLGAWARPHPLVRLGLGVLAPRNLLFHGTLRVESPAVLGELVPSYAIRPVGRIEFEYLMPVSLNSEVAFDLGETEAALHFQWSHRSIQRVFIANITEAEPAFLEGRQLIIKHNANDWALGARVKHAMPLWPNVEGAVRCDFAPRYVPKEALTPVNLSFTLLQTEVGLRWHMQAERELGLSYGFVYTVPIEVENSMFNPRAPSSSGLSSPSANGRYEAWAHKIVLSVVWGWPGKA